MAEVFEAERIGPHGFRKRVAVKRVLPHVASLDAYVPMFVEEADLAARLDHPNVVQVFDFGEDGDELYLAMELVEGPSIGRVLRALALKGLAFELDVALHLGVAAARALSYVHRLEDERGEPLGLIHRDVSPGNLLITPGGHLKLADFGIACSEGRRRRTDADQVRGKVGYMSPEQVKGERLSPKTDVFNLTIVLTEMLLGETLFCQGSDLDVLLRIRDVDLAVLHASQRPIPADVRRVLLWGLDELPERRPSARELADGLEAILCQRGLANAGCERVAHLLRREGLVEAREVASSEPGARPTMLVETDALPPQPVAQVVADRELGPQPDYYAWGSDGEPLGPVKYPELARLTSTGVVDSATLVARDRYPAQPAIELPELRRFFATPALQWRAEELTQAQHRGGLGGAHLLPLIHRLAAKRETGMLFLDGPIKRKKIYFVEGRPDFVASTDRGEMLGHYLVDNQHCMPMELDMGLALLPRHGGRLGDALVDISVLRPVQLYRAVAAQVRSRYLEAFRWRDGEWLYVRGATANEETYPIEQDAQVLMRDAAMQLHESELEAALAPHWEKVLRPHPAVPVQLSAYQVPDSWRWVIEQVRGETTVGALFGRCSRQSGLDEDDAMRALVLGLSCQLIEAA